jgi:GAF domain-containing protein
MAVPITLEGKVVGVLDVQENRIAGLDEGDAALLRSLANQVAVAINNARLFEEVETALADARAAQRRYVEQAWDASTVARRSASRVQFSLGESTTLSEFILAEARKRALTQTEPSVIAINQHDEVVTEELLLDSEESTVTESDDLQHILVAPIALGETVIGNLQLHEVDPNRQWSEGELALIEAVIDQVAQTAENLRLFDQTRERASREQLISQVSDKLRRAPDMESLMKVATSEISRVLNPARTFIRFDPNDKSVENGDAVAATDNGNVETELPQADDDSVAVEQQLEE